MGNRFYSTPLNVRFWAKVQIADGCWLWLGAHDDKGYGQIRSAGRGPLLKAHRVSWELHNGPIPEGANALHRCDNPPCVRPDHLFLGTLADNSQDAAAKGRLVYQAHPERCPRGERHLSAKLTEADVVEVRRAWRAGEASQPALASRYGVTQAAIWQAIHGASWSHVA